MFDSWNTNPQTPGKSLISVLKVVIFVLWLIFSGQVKCSQSSLLLVYCEYSFTVKTNTILNCSLSCTWAQGEIDPKASPDNCIVDPSILL